MTDVMIIETGNGGDLVANGNDLAMVQSFENMPYLAMFGGNVESSTPIKRIATEQANDYWANSLLFTNDTSKQFNSLTEKTLNTTTLNSAGRIDIENAVKADLDFMKEFAELSVNVQILSDDVVKINITIKKPDNLQEAKYIYIWQAGKLSQNDTLYQQNAILMDDDFLDNEINVYL